MNIILKVLEELLFFVRDEFYVECNLDAQKSTSVKVKIMISAENDSQVFLVIECDDSQLAEYVDGKIIKEIAVNFRKNEHHRAEMDRNTALLLVCKHDIDTIDSSSKVKIEDDPYYFKKYVFSYDEIGLKNADSWIKEHTQNATIISLIQEYITDTDHFAKYKENHQNEATYTFFMELVTKLHCFPMKPVEAKNLKTVADYLQEEIDTLRNQPRNPLDIDLNKLESFIESDVDYNNPDDVCEKWHSLFMEGNEE